MLNVTSLFRPYGHHEASQTPHFKDVSAEAQGSMHGMGRVWVKHAVLELSQIAPKSSVPFISLSSFPPESQTLTPTLGDVTNPGQGLVPTFLDDLHVADLESKNRSGQELGM